MQMTLRWYGSKYDTVTLKQIRQIPGVTGVISTLYGTAPGEAWELEDILALKKEIEDAGLQLAGIESVNIHDAIKVGTPDRDIDNYITTLERLGQADIHMVCYNFMPVFDWTRTELARMRPDGSTVLAYTQEAVDALDPEKMFESIAGDTNGTVMPGWEPERMARICSPCTRTWTMKSSLPICSIFWSGSCPPATNTTSTWPSTRTTLPGAYSVCPASSSTKPISCG